MSILARTLRGEAGLFAGIAGVILLCVASNAGAVPVLPIAMTRSARPGDLAQAATHGMTLAPGASVDLVFNLSPGTGLGRDANVYDWLALYEDSDSPEGESAGTVGVFTGGNHRQAWGGRGVFGASGINAELPEASPPAAVPEPATGGLLLAGLVGPFIGIIRRRLP